MTTWVQIAGTNTRLGGTSTFNCIRCGTRVLTTASEPGDRLCPKCAVELSRAARP